MQKTSMTLEKVAKQIDQHQGTLAMQGQLRQAIFDAITEQDVTQMVKKQVDKAKQGDEKALQFVMKYVLGFGQPITLQQINVIDVETAARIAKKTSGNR
jgi:hypothetical protein